MGKYAKFFLVLAIAVIMVGSFSGCATMRTSMGKLGDMDLENAEATRELAKKLLTTWQLNSGFLRGALGDKINELPMSAVTAMDELDALAAKTPEDITDFDLGYSLGVRVRMLVSVVWEAFKIYCPDLIDFLPALIGA